MKNQFTLSEEFDTSATPLINSSTLNNSKGSNNSDEEMMDFDFDYDPNEMYYALLNED